MIDLPNKEKGSTQVPFPNPPHVIIQTQSPPTPFFYLQSMLTFLPSWNQTIHYGNIF